MEYAKNYTPSKWGFAVFPRHKLFFSPCFCIVLSISYVTDV